MNKLTIRLFGAMAVLMFLSTPSCGGGDASQPAGSSTGETHEMRFGGFRVILPATFGEVTESAKGKTARGEYGSRTASIEPIVEPNDPSSVEDVVAKLQQQIKDDPNSGIVGEPGVLQHERGTKATLLHYGTLVPNVGGQDLIYKLVGKVQVNNRSTVCAFTLHYSTTVGDPTAALHAEANQILATAIFR